MRGDGVHQHAARVGRFTAGHINAHAVERRDFLAQQTAVGVAVAPALAAGFFLRFVVAAHPRCRRLQSVALHGGNGVERGFQFGLRQFERSHAGRIQAVKAGGVFQHRRIAALAHVSEDVGHALLNGGVSVG